jgi:hypothetical protein
MREMRNANIILIGILESKVPFDNVDVLQRIPLK